MEDLKKLFSIYSVHKSEQEKEMCDWIENKLIELGQIPKRIGNTLYQFDKEDRPLLSAHLDIVDTNGKAEHFLITTEDKLMAFNKDWKQTSLGADDKCGCWIILKLLERGCEFNYCFSEGEEAGLVGINKLKQELKEYEDNFTYSIVLDRKGFGEVLSSGTSVKYCDTLAKCIINFAKLYGFEGFKVGTGTCSDTNVIKDYIEAVNISVGYYNQHFSTEYVILNELTDTLDFVEILIDNFVHYKTEPKGYGGGYVAQTQTNVTSFNNYKDSYGKDWNDEYNSWYHRRGL